MVLDEIGREMVKEASEPEHAPTALLQDAQPYISSCGDLPDAESLAGG